MPTSFPHPPPSTSKKSLNQVLPPFFHAKWFFSRFLNRLLIAQYLKIILKMSHFTTLRMKQKIVEHFQKLIFSRSLNLEIDLQKRPIEGRGFGDGYFKKGLSLTGNHVPYTSSRQRWYIYSQVV